MHGHAFQAHGGERTCKYIRANGVGITGGLSLASKIRSLVYSECVPGIKVCSRMLLWLAHSPSTIITPPATNHVTRPPANGELAIHILDQSSVVTCPSKLQAGGVATCALAPGCHLSIFREGCYSRKRSVYAHSLGYEPAG